ncbi:MAG: phosphoglycerate kinase [Candidatus Gracilibacteria bacterium]|nr:phosphoglycerate kinase [Candidatus Gracilibacteria bacterium]MDQ7022337.1 phosphoglycerate kinase [Candidatus Gracilibacteria bacterium]
MLQKIQNIDIENKRVFLRCDFNVPFDKNGIITDYTRVNAVLKTIKYLLKNNCSIVISSHLGRPKDFEQNFSLAPVQRVLRALLRLPIILASGVSDEKTIEQAKKLKSGEILLLENLRFDSREKKNDENFAKELASMGEIYINDAFGVSHRSHTSVDKITDYFLEGEKAAGFLLQKENKYFKDKINNPERPFIAIVGGAKVSSKLLTIKKLLEKVDKIIIGGAMAFTFLKAEGYEIGKSLVENDLLEEAKNIIETAKKLNKELILPVDFIISDKFGENGIIKTVNFDKIPENFMGLDIGAKSIKLFEKKSESAKMIFWNGPMGAYEFDSFFEGSASIANILANSKGETFAGGGDSIAVINKMGLGQELSFISTGGGASLELLEGKKLVGIEKLKIKKISKN